LKPTENVSSLDRSGNKTILVPPWLSEG
jgi:hypothetical protein